MACVSALLSLYADVAFKPFPGVEDGARLVTIAQVNDVQQSGITLRFTETIDEEVSAIEAATGVAWRLR